MEKFDLTPIETLMSDSINKLNNMKTDNETILRYEILSILKSAETDAKKRIRWRLYANSLCRFA